MTQPLYLYSFIPSWYRGQCTPWKNALVVLSSFWIFNGNHLHTPWSARTLLSFLHPCQPVTSYVRIFPKLLKTQNKIKVHEHAPAINQSTNPFTVCLYCSNPIHPPPLNMNRTVRKPNFSESLSLGRFRWMFSALGLFVGSGCFVAWCSRESWKFFDLGSTWLANWSWLAQAGHNITGCTKKRF